jgi:hypothetical protein
MHCDCEYSKTTKHASTKTKRQKMVALRARRLPGVASAGAPQRGGSAVSVSTSSDANAVRGRTQDLSAATREELAKLNDKLFAIWNLGENILLGWTYSAGGLLFPSVRHYIIPEFVHAGADAARLVNAVLSGPKHLEPEEFQRIRRIFKCSISAVRINFNIGDERISALISDMVRRYSVSLVNDRAVVLLDAVKFSLQSPLDQMAMLNSLAYSVNSAYGQLLTKDIKINFARTTTGDGFYIWNRVRTDEANTELYKLMMMILADNALAQRKARSSWVPQLRAAFHIGEHYEFHQVEGLSPTPFSYIVGQVTVDLARMLECSLPNQILLGDFSTQVGGSGSSHAIRYNTLGFVENTVATLHELEGLEISGGRIENIRCYLTGDSLGDGRFMVNRSYIRDKHGTMRAVYNAKINIYCGNAEPIFLGIPHNGLGDFAASKVESLNRDEASEGSLLVRH